MGRITEPDLLQVSARQHPEGWLVQLSGEVDLGNVETLEAELGRLDGHKPIIVDLRDLDFIDSAALLVFVSTADKTANRVGRLKIRNASDQVERLFRLCGLDHFILSAAR